MLLPDIGRPMDIGDVLRIGRTEIGFIIRPAPDAEAGAAQTQRPAAPTMPRKPRRSRKAPAKENGCADLELGQVRC